MKRRIRWPVSLHGWFAARRRTPVRTAAGPARQRLMPSRIVLRFTDGSSLVLDPTSTTAIEIHRIADRWLTGR